MHVGEEATFLMELFATTAKTLGVWFSAFTRPDPRNSQNSLLLAFLSISPQTSLFCFLSFRDKVSPCSPGCPRPQKSTGLFLPSAGIKSVRHHRPASSNFFTNTILNPHGCLYIASSSLHTYTTLSPLRPSMQILKALGPLRFLSTSSPLGPSTIPQSKRLLCIISSRLLPLDGLSWPTSSLQLSASCLNPNSRHS